LIEIVGYGGRVAAAVTQETREARRRSRRRRQTGFREVPPSFRVVPQSGSGEQTFLVLSPAGVGLYSFADVGAAAAEAAELNSLAGLNSAGEQDR
jgi:hypothetical protein